MSHRLVREHIAKDYWEGAYPRDIEELARFVNDKIFGGKYYSIKRIDDRGRTHDALRALGSHELHVVFVMESRTDKVGHWIVLVNKPIPKTDGHRYVIDSNLRYFAWSLNGQNRKLVIRREKNRDFQEDGVDIHVQVHSAISIDPLPKIAAPPSVL